MCVYIPKKKKSCWHFERSYTELYITLGRTDISTTLSIPFH